MRVCLRADSVGGCVGRRTDQAGSFVCTEAMSMFVLIAERGLVGRSARGSVE